MVTIIMLTTLLLKPWQRNLCLIEKGSIIVLEISLKLYLMKMLLCFSLQDYYLLLWLEFGNSLFDNVWWNHTLSTTLQYLLQSLWLGITILLV